MLLNRQYRRASVRPMEVLVLIIAIMIVIGLLIPACGKIQRESPWLVTQCDLQYMVFAMHDHASAHDNWIPPGFDGKRQWNGKASGDKDDPVDRRGGTMFYYLLPYMEGDTLYKTRTPQDNVTASFRSFYDPVDPTNQSGSSYTSYAINPNMEGPTNLPGSFPRGCSNTVSIVERAAVCQDGGRPWATTPDWDFNATGGPEPFTPPTGSRFATAFIESKCYLAMMDGSVRAVQIRQPSFPIACRLKQTEPPTPLGPDW
jgi:hypothetical protein